ncbi:hypothetical protein KC963_03230, partial [Candidatus Saccharibacteria bacterium]|nr:hypothetical protein [Candidatus Saccharibacteria bacterium]
ITSPEVDSRALEYAAYEELVAFGEMPPAPEPPQAIEQVQPARRFPGRFRLAVHRARYMFRAGYHEELGSNMGHARILLGSAQPICRVDEYDAYLGRAPITQPEPALPVEQPQSQTIEQAASKPRRITNWLLKKSVQINTLAHNTIERARRRPVVAVAAGGVALVGAAIGFKYGFSARGSGSTNIVDAITQASQTKPNTQSAIVTDWFHQFEATHPGVSFTEFSGIINSREFAAMCENPEEFAKFLALQG